MSGSQRHVSLQQQMRHGLPRQLSLGSIFRDQAAVLKEAAEKDPSDMDAQVKLMEYWLARGALQPDALSDLVLKYETDTYLFNTASQPPTTAKSLLENKRAWDLYLQALVSVPDDSQLSPSDKIESATARRDAILSGQSVVEPFTEPSQPPQGAAESSTASAAPELSRSQIASAALARGGTQEVKVLNDANATPQSGASSHAGGSKGSYQGASSSVSGAAGAGASAGAGNKSEPIRVVVEEARGNLLFRAFRFLLVVAVYSFVSLTLISLVIDGSGLMRAGTSKNPVQEFQPQGGNKVVTFADGTPTSQLLATSGDS